MIARIALALAIGLLIPAFSEAAEQKHGSSPIKPPAETVVPIFRQAIPNVPGKSLIAAVVTYPPGGASPAHTHPASAFIYAYVLSGEIRSQVDAAPARTYRPGESWQEVPGAHHTVSANASRTKPAQLLAIFVVNTGDEPLVVPDPK